MYIKKEGGRILGEIDDEDVEMGGMMIMVNGMLLLILLLIVVGGSKVLVMVIIDLLFINGIGGYGYGLDVMDIDNDFWWEGVDLVDGDFLNLVLDLMLVVG